MHIKKALLLGIVFCFGVGMLLNAGCAKRAASASEAIQNSQTLMQIGLGAAEVNKTRGRLC